MEAKALIVEKHAVSDRIVLRLTGRLCADTLLAVSSEIERFPFETVRLLVLDLAGTNLIDSTAIGALVRWQRRFREHNGKIRLRNARNGVLQALKLCNLGSFIDINTEPEFSEEQICGQRDRADAAQALHGSTHMEALATLASDMAHELNNLMVGVLGNAKMLHTDLEDNSSARGMLEEIDRAGRRASELARQILAFTGGGKQNLAEVDLRQIVESSVSTLKKICPPRVQIKMSIAPDLYALRGDAGHLRLLLKGLLLNAMEAIQESGWIEVSVENELRKSNPQIQIVVRDNGCGMDETTRARLSKPMEITGQGLGLAAARTIVKNHGGAISAESTPGKGTTLQITLPASSSARVEKTASPVPDERTASKTILVIDDQDMVRRVAQIMLQRQGYKVLTASGAQEALQLVQQHSGAIDLALLDMNMPQVSGADIFQPLREMRPDMKIVISSGCDMDEDAETLLKQGAAGFLPKPFDPQSMGNVVKKVLGSESEA